MSASEPVVAPASNEDTTDMFRALGDMVDGMDALSVIKGSLCMACGESGDTRMMTTKIPFFREIIVCSFECDSCGDTNNEVTFGGEIQEKGVKFVLQVCDEDDLSRTCIKADSCTVRVPMLDFEIPARSQKGGITTVQGILSRAAENLNMYQRERMEDSPAIGAAVAVVIARLMQLSMGEGGCFPFTVELDDPSGNSFVENYCAPKRDPKLLVKHYERTPRQDLAIGLQISEDARKQLDAEGSDGMINDSNRSHGALKGIEVDNVDGMLKAFAGVDLKAEQQRKKEKERAAGAGASTSDEAKLVSAAAEVGIPKDYVPWVQEPLVEEDLATSLGRREVIRMGTPCPNCSFPGETLTCFTDIPHFKEVIIMAFDCLSCGYRSNEVKAGGGVPTRGQIFTLVCESPADLSRDVLKSASADVIIPEIDFEASQASLGGVFTTVEGLLTKVHTTMLNSTPYMMGDSAQDSSRKSTFQLFNDKFAAIAAGDKFPFTLQLRDPLANSFIGLSRDVETLDQDKNLMVDDYERTWDEDEEYGLHDIDVAELGGTVDETNVLGGSHKKNPYLAEVNKRWGPDHPHMFAKGCDDSVVPTPIGGDGDQGKWATYEADQGETSSTTPAAAAAVTTTTTTENESGEEKPFVASGWSGPAFGTIPLTQTRGTAAPGRSPLAEPIDAAALAASAATDRADEAFVASESFQGAREGLCFRMGSKGLGYYRLATLPPPSS